MRIDIEYVSDVEFMELRRVCVRIRNISLCLALVSFAVFAVQDMESNIHSMFWFLGVIGFVSNAAVFGTFDEQLRRGMMGRNKIIFLQQLGGLKIPFV